MRKLISMVTLASMLLVVCGTRMMGPLASDQSDPLQRPLKDWERAFAGKLPRLAAIGSTPERRAAWDKLTPSERQQMLEEFRIRIGPLIQNAIQERLTRGKTQGSPAPNSLQSGDPRLSSELTSSILTDPVPDPIDFQDPLIAPDVAITGSDLDGDGLPDDFENALAKLFRPAYRVSAGEKAGTGFATFGDFVPQTVLQTFGPVPPFRYFRVTPLPKSGGNGFLQIDYLTLWNRDDGLDISAGCIADLTVLLGLIGLGTAEILDGLSAHPLDNERSAVRVFAPTTGPAGAKTFNTNPRAYSADQFFTAAHEDTFSDQSLLFTASPPLPAGSHIQLALARSKHSTYPFNPNGLPLVPSGIIDAVFAGIDFLFLTGQIDELQYLVLLFIADSVFFSCVTERFQDQGGTLAGTRVNVGELTDLVKGTQPINGSHFIDDPGLRSKLLKVFAVP